MRALLMALALLAPLPLSAAGGQTPMHFVAKEYPPYVYAGADGQPAGPMVELLFAACAKANWQCSVHLLPWRRAFKLATDGQVDGVFPIVHSPAREAAFDLSPDIVRGRYVLVAPPCESECPVRSEAGGRRIAAFGPSEASRTLLELADTWPGTQVEIETEHHVVLRKLLAGRYGSNGLALVNEAVAQWQLTAAGAQDLREVGVVRELQYTYALVRKPHRPDASALRFFDALNQACLNGTTAQSLKPYGLLAADCQRSSVPTLPSHRYILR